MGGPLLRTIEGLGRTVEIMIGFAMKLAPLGVAGLIFAVTARFGFEILQSLGLYVVVVFLGLGIHLFAVIPFLARTLAGQGYRTFFRRAKGVMITAFSTSSSNATLPTTIRTAQEQFGVPRTVAGFVMPLGATMNMNGAALFEAVTVLLDRILDMARTVPNVTGDLLTSMVVARSEGAVLLPDDAG